MGLFGIELVRVALTFAGNQVIQISLTGLRDVSASGYFSSHHGLGELVGRVHHWIFSH